MQGLCPVKELFLQRETVTKEKSVRQRSLTVHGPIGRMFTFEPCWVLSTGADFRNLLYSNLFTLLFFIYFFPENAV